MRKNPLIGVSIIAVALLILGSLTNVVGYQTVQSSNQIAIKEEINQKELLFQTIIDIVDNKEIQKIAFNSEMRKGIFFDQGTKFSTFNAPVLTKNNLKHMYLVGLMLSKIISKSRIHTMIQQYRFTTPELQKEIAAVIEKDASLKGEITQLSNSKCDCGENSGFTVWPFPVICTILNIILFFDFFLVWYIHIGNNLAITIEILLEKFHCPGWTS